MLGSTRKRASSLTVEEQLSALAAAGKRFDGEVTRPVIISQSSRAHFAFLIF